MKTMRNYLMLFLICVVVTSCNTENEYEESIQEKSISDVNFKSEDFGITYIESQHLRDQIDGLGIIDLDRSQFDLKVNLQLKKITVIEPVGEPMPPQGRIIRWSVNEASPGVPAGIYLLDTCTGTLYNILGRNMGTLAGTWGNNWFDDCD